MLGEKSYLKPTGHNVVNRECVNCDYQRKDFTNIDIYASDYGYNYLGTLTNGSKMQTLYLRIAEAAKDFHINNKTATEIKISCSDLGFKTTDSYVQLAISRFLYDHPLYYWVGSQYSYSYSGSTKVISSVILLVNEDYSNGSVRAEYNSMIYKAAEEYYALVETEESEYNITLAYYDMIIAATDYAFESDGKTPQDDAFAHSIIGLFTGQGVVCEGYAKALQMFLTLSDVESVYVSGDAGGGHAWTLIKLDDGKWYWFDITWDDAGYYQSTWLPGRTYFANTDSTSDGEEVFIESHVPYLDYGWGWPSIPDRAESAFESDDIVEVLQNFTVDGNSYQVVGYRSVHLVSSTAKGSFEVPEIVLFDGVIYDVVGLGVVTNYGYMNIDSIFAKSSVTSITFGEGITRIQGLGYCTSLTKVTISASVKEIDQYAFVYCSSLANIYFEGTRAEWNDIQKDSTWKQGCKTITVHCSDGNITV